MKSGILLIDKPEGPTSAHVVREVKAVLGAKKVGHLGSLDPFASGLLLVGVEEGTKMAQIFLTASKSYTGTVSLGTETDTLDRTGQVLQVRDVPQWGAAELEQIRVAFIGLQWQRPPMFSALKRSGVPLYRLARQGKSVPRARRQVMIDKLLLWKLSRTEIEFEVHCSKGTYIRTLAADMGTALGCGGHLKRLRRLTCGPYGIKQSVSLEDFKSCHDKGRAPLVSLVDALGSIPRMSLSPSTVAGLRAGRQDLLADWGGPETEEGRLGLLDRCGNLVALAHWTKENGEGRWRLLRVFSHPGP